MLTIKRVTWVITVLITICAAFFIGSFIGFKEGYAFGVFHRSASEAYLTLTQLQSLNAGNVKSTKNSLEQRLDTYIIEHSAGLDNKLFMALLPGQDSIYTLMKEVALYRAAKPSTFDNKIIKDGIDTVVARYIAKPN